MRKFSSYGPVDKGLHFYVPRKELIEKAFQELTGENPEKEGHYITIWAPRQAGKTWVMNEVLFRLMEDKRFHVLKLELEYLKTTEDTDEIVESVAGKIIQYLNLKHISISNLKEFEFLFKKDVLQKPLILILDEFDALEEDAIASIAGVFRNIYNSRRKDPAPSHEKEYLLHGVALIGVRSVLGVENVKGSPFNVQRSMNIQNLTFEETDSMFKRYEQESGQKAEQEVIDRVFSETQGQPGLVSWFGELLTEKYNKKKDQPLTAELFNYVFRMAVRALPNNNIINIISKAKQYKDTVLELFKTEEKTEFAFDDPHLNFLYMNGVIDTEESEDNLYVRFSCPFVQKRLFNYFSREIFSYMGKIFEPFEDLNDTIAEDSLNIKNLVRRYEMHLRKNREWLLKDVPRRKDLRVFEAVYHFNLYEYLNRFLANRNAKVLPEFPTGNGAIDLIIRYAGKIYGLELKSYTNESDFKKALKQAADYGASLKLDRIHLIVFVEYIPDEYRLKYEADCQKGGVTVVPVFVSTGE
ncbi:MAG: hypothetical protein GY795_40915 [Desulfobacterales bacterium]|nr:hypothetical protein [Desulfobacterales bacterium]